MHDTKVWGPKGEPASEPSVSRYTKVPWELVQRKDAAGHTQHDKAATPQGGWELSDKNAMMGKLISPLYEDVEFLHLTRFTVNDSEDIFGEADEVRHHYAVGTDLF